MSGHFQPTAYYAAVTAEHVAPNVLTLVFTDDRLPVHDQFRLVLPDGLAQQVADALAAAGVVAEAVKA